MSFKKKKSNKLKLFLYILLFVLCLLTALFYILNKDHGPSEQVLLSDEGFSAPAITVRKGTKVVWKIEGKKKHWPASNFHPTHEEYPEGGGCLGSKLDACSALNPGETYSFTFDQEGEFGMHDHLFPGFTMVVKVAGSEKGANTNQGNITGIDYLQEEKKVKLMSKKDPVKAWEYLKTTYYKSDSVQYAGAHSLVHIAANELYNKFGLEGLKTCDYKFSYGCHHGVIEALLIKKGDGGIEEIENYCAVEFLPNRTQDFGGCIHGVGHGLVTWHGNDLRKSLKGCEAVREDYRYSCFDGVYMEYVTSVPPHFFDRFHPWKLCINLPDDHQPKCAKYQSAIAEIKFNLGFEEMAKICESAPRDVLERECVIGLSSYIGRIVNGDTKEIQKRCYYLQPKNRYDCILSAGQNMIQQRYPNWSRNSEEICGILLSEEKDRCIKMIVSTKETYNVK
jgi:plastocyanin